MVFENLTLVELHLENSRFDGTIGRDPEEEAAETDAETEAEADEESGGRSLRGPVTFLLLLVVGAGLVARRRRKQQAADSEPAAAEQISIEQAADQ